MPFKFQRLTSAADVLAWVKIHYLAYCAAEPYRWIRPPTEKSFQQLATSWEAGLKEDKNHHVFKAVDTDADDKVVGVATWFVWTEEQPLDEGAGKEKKVKDSENSTEEEVENYNIEARRAFRHGLKQARREVIGTKPHVCLAGVMVLPEYQKKGIGKRLMQWGIEEADRLNLVVYLEASEIAKSMYEQYGFKYIRPVEFDTRKFGGDHIKTDWVMIRQPQLNEIQKDD